LYEDTYIHIIDIRTSRVCVYILCLFKVYRNIYTVHLFVWGHIYPSYKQTYQWGVRVYDVFVEGIHENIYIRHKNLYEDTYIHSIETRIIGVCVYIICLCKVYRNIHRICRFYEGICMHSLDVLQHTATHCNTHSSNMPVCMRGYASIVSTHEPAGCVGVFYVCVRRNYIICLRKIYRFIYTVDLYRNYIIEITYIEIISVYTEIISYVYVRYTDLYIR